MKILILGAGGHAQVVADIFFQQKKEEPNLEVLGYLDDAPELVGRTILHLPVLGALDRLPQIAHDGIIVAIGANQIRARIFSSLREKGEHFVNAIHPTATIAPDVHMGVGVMICAGVVVNTGTEIGDNVILNTQASVDHHNRIASHVHIAPGVRLGGNVTVGVGGMVGIGASIIPGCMVGDCAIVGAGAAVIHDIPPGATAVGVPARVMTKRK